MKKIYLLLVVVLCVALASACNNKKVQPTENADSTLVAEPQQQPGCQMSEADKAELDAIKAQFGNWASLDQNAKVEAIAKAKAFVDKKDAEMTQNGQDPMQSLQNLPEDQKAAFAQKWANFANLTPDEQKALLDQKLQGCCNGNGTCPNGGQQPQPQAAPQN